MNVAVLVPVLNPDEKFVTYIDSLVSYGFDHIIVVNDGSAERYDPFFSRVKKHPQCVVLRHKVNKGKGRALKSGFKYFLQNLSGLDGVVTADADGQHTLADTAAIARMMETERSSLILGTRDFSLPHVPARSRFGNRLTSAVFRLLYGLRISDTQTGLRGVPTSLLPVLIESDGERYDYETNMLVECADRKIGVIEHPIETVYIDDNATSHFNPVKDSVRVYWLLLRSPIKYLISGVTCFAIDQIVFRVLRGILPESGAGTDDRLPWLLSLALTYAAASGARIISSVASFYFNKHFVFKKQGGTAKSSLRFLILVVFSLCVSAGLTWLTHTFLLPAVSEGNIKIIFDALLVIFNYVMQRSWVFKKDSDII